MAERVRDIVNKILQRDAIFAHHEDILMAILVDNEAKVHELEWRQILKFCTGISPPAKTGHSYFAETAV